MEQLEPGSLIQYQGSLAPPPSWPAVVCTDDMAPKDLLRSRPRGVSTILILILGSLTFRWATPKDLSEYDPFMPILQGQMVARVPGLGDAYGMANNHLDSSLDLEYWRERVGGTITIDSDLELDSEDSMDTEFQQALRASRDDYLRKNPASRSLLTPSQSPPIVLPSPQVSRTAATQNSTRFFGVPLPNNTIDLTDEEVPTDETPKRTEPATKPLSQQTCILDTTNLSSIFNKPTSDTIDGELTQSKHFIHVPVGPKSQLRVLPQQSLWNRPYFRDPRRGLNHFDYIDNTWILRHPALRHINPADFDFAAEYLESDDFGIRLPLDPRSSSSSSSSSSEDYSIVLQQCYAAWSVADRLDMHDLMEHVVDKLEGITPGRDEMMVFACRIFGKKGGGDLPGHYRLKEYLARFIAEDWWGYVRELGEWFVERLEGLPELERDVCEKRLEALNERLDREEEEEEEVEGGEDMEID